MSPATVTPAQTATLSCPCAGRGQTAMPEAPLCSFRFSVCVPVPLRGTTRPQPRKEQTMNQANNSEQPKAAPAYQNRVILVGYLGREPEQLEGRAVLSLATNTSWKPK